jgi:hypothetical protein
MTPRQRDRRLTHASHPRPARQPNSLGRPPIAHLVHRSQATAILLAIEYAPVPL